MSTEEEEEWIHRCIIRYLERSMYGGTYGDQFKYWEGLQRKSSIRSHISGHVQSEVVFGRMCLMLLKKLPVVIPPKVVLQV